MPPPRSTPDVARIEEAKARSTSQLLLKSARLLNELAVVRVRRLTGEQRLRPSHTSLFPHIDWEGTRLTTLAARMGITKQAVSELVADLDAMEMLERVPDPADGRAKLIRFSPRGREGVMHGLATLATIEEDVTKRVGPVRVRRLADALARALPALEELLARER